MFEWFDRVGYDVDIAALHRQFPEVGGTVLPTGRTRSTGAPAASAAKADEMRQKRCHCRLHE